MPLCDMDDYTTLDGQNICGQILFIIQGTFYSTPFLMNWSGRGLVMDELNLIQPTIKKEQLNKP